MNCKITCDSFVVDNYFKEDYAGGAWIDEDINEDEAARGIVFLPESNLLKEEFEAADKNEKFAVTVIQGNGSMVAKTDLNYDEATKFIEESKSDLNDNDIASIGIYEMKKSVPFAEYVRTLE